MKQNVTEALKRDKVVREASANVITPDISITKYGHTRFWAVWLDEELLAVVCYKKGATAIREAILGFTSQLSQYSGGAERERGVA